MSGRVGLLIGRWVYWWVGPICRGRTRAWSVGTQGYTCLIASERTSGKGGGEGVHREEEAERVRPHLPSPGSVAHGRRPSDPDDAGPASDEVAGCRAAMHGAQRRHPTAHHEERLCSGPPLLVLCSEPPPPPICSAQMVSSWATSPRHRFFPASTGEEPLCPRPPPPLPHPGAAISPSLCLSYASLTGVGTGVTCGGHQRGSRQCALARATPDDDRARVRCPSALSVLGGDGRYFFVWTRWRRDGSHECLGVDRGALEIYRVVYRTPLCFVFSKKLPNLKVQ
jgi:hypothetical protein